MISILTGDIINSRKVDPKIWLPELKAVLNSYGKQPKKWEIYRGDSFQIEMNPIEALNAAIILKATMKQYKPLDIRIAIGIGDKTYHSAHIKEANGSAFVRSGECFEGLKKRNMGLKSPWDGFDDTINIMIQLSLLAMDNWKPAYSRIIKTALQHPEKNQNELANFLNKTQGTISMGLKKVGYDEILKMITYYQNYIQNI